MAREQPKSGGGKDLASLVYDFLNKNQNIMKTEAVKRDANQNQIIGLEDLSRAIAFGIEEALKQTYKVTSDKLKADIQGTGLQYTMTGTMIITTVGTVPVTGTLFMTGGGTSDLNDINGNIDIAGLNFDFNK